MNREQLVNLLNEYPADTEIMILDGFNGQGQPREINCGPTPRVVTPEDAEGCADCEHRVGEHIVVLGYGFY